jgi:hypothetical protein
VSLFLIVRRLFEPRLQATFFSFSCLYLGDICFLDRGSHHFLGASVFSIVEIPITKVILLGVVS